VSAYWEPIGGQCNFIHHFFLLLSIHINKQFDIWCIVHYTGVKYSRLWRHNMTKAVCRLSFLYDLNTFFSDLTTSRYITLKCVPSQYGWLLVCLQAHNTTCPSLSGVKRSGRMLGALVLCAPSQKGCQENKTHVCKKGAILKTNI